MISEVRGAFVGWAVVGTVDGLVLTLAEGVASLPQPATTAAIRTNTSPASRLTVNPPSDLDPSVRGTDEGVKGLRSHHPRAPHPYPHGHCLKGTDESLTGDHKVT